MPDDPLTGPASRLTSYERRFLDLQSGPNLLELNGMLEQERDPVKRGVLQQRLEQWAQYYAEPAHRAEIEAIMAHVVLPFLREHIGDEIVDVQLAPDSPRGSDILIMGTQLAPREFVEVGPAAPQAPGRPPRHAAGRPRR